MSFALRTEVLDRSLFPACSILVRIYAPWTQFVAGFMSFTKLKLDYQGNIALQPPGRNQSCATWHTSAITAGRRSRPGLGGGLLTQYLTSLPRIPPHIGIPATLVHLDEVEIREHAAVVFQTVLLNHPGNESIGLIIVPAPLAHETVVNQNLLVCESPAIGQAPVKNLRSVLPESTCASTSS